MPVGFNQPRLRLVLVHPLNQFGVRWKVQRFGQKWLLQWGFEAHHDMQLLNSCLKTACHQERRVWYFKEKGRGWGGRWRAESDECQEKPTECFLDAGHSPRRWMIHILTCGMWADATRSRSLISGRMKDLMWLLLGSSSVNCLSKSLLFQTPSPRAASVFRLSGSLRSRIYFFYKTHTHTHPLPGWMACQPPRSQYSLLNWSWFNMLWAGVSPRCVADPVLSPDRIRSCWIRKWLGPWARPVSTQSVHNESEVLG